MTYLSSVLKNKSKSTEVMDKFLRSSGKESYYCVKEFYCKLRSEEEMWSDIYTSFIVLVDRYVYKDRHFNAYVHNSIGYEIGRTIYKSLRDMRDHKGLTADFFDTDANLSDDKDTIENNLDIIEGYEYEGELTDKWIREQQSDEESMFSILSSIEKDAVLNYYINKTPDKLIAERLNKHTNTVNNARRAAIKRLGDKYTAKAKRTRRYTHKECV